MTISMPSGILGGSMTAGEELINKARGGKGVDRDEALTLLTSTKLGSKEMHLTMYAADRISRG